MENATLEISSTPHRVSLFSRTGSYDEPELLSGLIPLHSSCENVLFRDPVAYTCDATKAVSFFYPAVTFDAVKRLTDIFLSTLLIILLSPVMLAAAAAVKLSSPGPIIFRQRRLTAGGKVFTMYKFRTMRVDAEHASGPVWAEENDPRVTPIGRFLRISHLDELPQLLNVLTGDMSFVGPRPERPELVEKLEAEFPGFKKRLTVKGGITGLAQVSEGYAADMQSYRKKLSYDLMYVKKRSLLLDLGILLKTVLVVITGMGAR